MFFKNIIFIFTFLISCSSQAVNDLKASIETMFDYRSDKIRSQVNNNSTSIRNFSIFAEKNTSDNSLFFIEFLGDENLTTSGLEFNLGEAYYRVSHKFKLSTSHIKIGSFKLDYGLLNPNDENYYILPSYYKFIYGLPRGIDTGLVLKNRILNSNFFFGIGLYMGKSFRSENIQQQETYGVPLSTSLRYKFSSNSVFSIDYFVREYEKNPKIRGLSLSYKGYFKIKSWELKILSELMSLNSNLSRYNSSAFAYMLAPSLFYRKYYTSLTYANENWKNEGKQHPSEDYISARLGYIFSNNIRFEIENLRIRDRKRDIYKENSFLARLYMNWSF